MLDDSIERYKAHLLARGFQQTQDHDYVETFAPVAYMNIVPTLLQWLLLLLLLGPYLIWMLKMYFFMVI